jgi:hypothetical protein
MSGRLASPLIQMTEPGYFMDRLLMAEHSNSTSLLGGW